MTKLHGLLAACAALPLFFGCAYSNPHGDQGLPPTKRLTTVPAGAEVLIERMNMRFETPCELPLEVEPADVITIRKDGYLPYRGELQALSQVSYGTYECKLGKK